LILLRRHFDAAFAIAPPASPLPIRQLSHYHFALLPLPPLTLRRFHYFRCCHYADFRHFDDDAAISPRR